MSKKVTVTNELKYGPILGSGNAEKYAMHIFKTSRGEKEEGRKGIPITVWGEAGIGKTELPKMLVKKYEDFFDNNIAYVPLAQIEEKAELQGLPETINIKKLLTPELEKTIDKSRVVVEEIKNEETGKVERWITSIRTMYGTPSWIPQAETHGARGLLVIDDMNRPDARILNSIMQLLQDAALLGWKLPDGWEILCTANPDNGKYEVTPLDGAQMSRSANFTMIFDEKSWLENWAIPTGIHQVAQNFMMTHVEFAVRGERTNPRSFDKFFRLIAPHLDELAKVKGNTIKANAQTAGGSIVREIQYYGQMNIESESLQAFISFLTSGFGKLPTVEEILDKKFNIDKFYESISTGSSFRTDILGALNYRLQLYVAKNSAEINKSKPKIAALTAWVKYKKLPGDLRLALIDNVLKDLPNIADAEICDLIFKRTLGSM